MCLEPLEQNHETRCIHFIVFWLNVDNVHKIRTKQVTNNPDFCIRYSPFSNYRLYITIQILSQKLAKYRLFSKSQTIIPLTNIGKA